MALPIVPPQLLGQRIFGDVPSFIAVQFTSSDIPSEIDSWLSLSPGTTQYGGAPGGRCWGFSGVFIEQHAADVYADIAIIQSYAGRCGALGLATGFSWPGDYKLWTNCRYVPEELSVGPVIASPGNQYRAAYVLVMRQVSRET